MTVLTRRQFAMLPAAVLVAQGATTHRRAFAQPILTAYYPRDPLEWRVFAGGRSRHGPGL